MIMACLAAITIVIKAERNDWGSPKGMAVIVVKRMKQYSVGAEQHEGRDCTKFCVDGLCRRRCIFRTKGKPPYQRRLLQN